MFKMVQISIIIPIYNVEEYLERCLDSILQQSFTDYEVVLIDDGSSDDSGSICDNYAQKDSRFIVIHQKNAGVAVARNKGLETATGLYVMYCDPDDYYIKDTLASCVSYIGKDSMYYDVYCTGFKSLYDDGHEEYKSIPKYGVYNRTQGLATMDSLYMGGFVCNKIYKRDLIEKNHVRFNKNFKSHEDKLFFIDFISCASTICLIPEEPYVYCIREGSLSFTFDNIKSRLEALQCIHERVMANFGGIARFWELGWTRDWLINYHMKVYGVDTKERYSDEERAMVSSFLDIINKEYSKHRIFYYVSRIIQIIKSKLIK